MPNCGIVDMGSNTVRLSIYRYDGEDFKLLLSKKEIVGLAGYVKDGILSAEGIAQAAQAAAGFHTLLNNLDIDEFHVFATASLRNTVNTAEAVAAIRAAAGVEVSVISGSEEAALSYLGALHGAPETEGANLLVDIGGGSTELVVHEGGEILSGDSLPIGSLSLHTQHVSGLFPTEGEAKAIRRHIRQALDEVGPQPCPHLRGVGGTIRAAGKLCGLAPGQVLPAKALRQLYHRLKKGDRQAFRDILRVAPERIHTLLPGLMILNAILKRYAVETVDVSAQGVREGYLLTHVLGREVPHVQAQ